MEHRVTAAQTGSGASSECDVLFRGLTVYDGTGLAPRVADVAVTGDRITAVGDLEGYRAQRMVTGPNLALAPGFIDAHTHDDRALLSDPSMTPKVSQGVTTVVTGNCGVSLSPLRLSSSPPPPLDALGDSSWYRFERFADYAHALREEPAATHAVCLVGHTSLRVGAMDRLDRAATPSECTEMLRRLEDALAHGASGISSGLFYPPAKAAPASEVVPLAAAAARAGGIYTAHIRDEADHIASAMDEAITIARESGARLVLSHHKLSGERNFGRSVETLARIARAQCEHCVGLDVYPYAAGSTMLNHDSRRAAQRVLVTWSTSHPAAAGRYLADIAAEWGISEEHALDRLQPGGAVYFMMSESDVQRILKFPHSMIGSDGLPHDPRPHPREWGTFPRVLGHYARKLKLFPIEEGVRRMTSLPAMQFGLVDRGVIALGAFADLCVFDPDTIEDAATFQDPKQPSRGIHAVFTAGRCVWQAGAPTGERPGRLLTPSHC